MNSKMIYKSENDRMPVQIPKKGEESAINVTFSPYPSILWEKITVLVVVSSDLYHKSSDLHVKSSDLFIKSLDLYHRSSDLHIKSLDLFIKSLDLHHRSLDLRIKSLDLHHKSLDLHHRSLDLQHKSLDLHHKSLDLHFKSSDLQCKSEEMRSKLQEVNYAFHAFFIKCSSKYELFSTTTLFSFGYSFIPNFGDRILILIFKLLNNEQV